MSQCTFQNSLSHWLTLALPTYTSKDRHKVVPIDDFSIIDNVMFHCTKIIIIQYLTVPREASNSRKFRVNLGIHGSKEHSRKNWGDPETHWYISYRGFSAAALMNPFYFLYLSFSLWFLIIIIISWDSVWLDKFLLSRVSSGLIWKENSNILW